SDFGREGEYFECGSPDSRRTRNHRYHGGDSRYETSRTRDRFYQENRRRVRRDAVDKSTEYCKIGKSHGLNGLNGLGASESELLAPNPLNPFNPWLTIL